MDSLTILLIAIPITIGVVVGLIIAGNNKKLFDSGAANKQRNYDYYLQEHTFKTTVQSLRDMYAALDKSSLTGAGISISTNAENTRYVFKHSSGSFAATIKAAGASNVPGICMYKFRMNSWHEHRGTMDNSARMGGNMVLTALEKAFLTLDFNAVVERVYVTDINTRSSFF